MTRTLIIISFVLIIIFYPGLSTTFSQLSFCCLLLEQEHLLVKEGEGGFGCYEGCAATLEKCDQEAYNFV